MSVFFPFSQPGGKTQIVDRAVRLTNRNWWVDSVTGTNAAGRGGSPDTPLASLAYLATNASTLGVSVNETVFLAPNHAEDLVAATTCVIATAGLQVIGLGDGALRPTITIKTATTALLSITAANVKVSNVRFVCDLDNVVKCIALAATADGAVLEDLYLANASNKKALIWIELAAACDDVTIRRVRVKGAGACQSAIKAVGAADNLVVEDCDLYGQWTVSAIDAGTAGGTNHRYIRNAIANEDATVGLCIKAHADTTGLAAFNGLAAAKANTQPYSAAKVWSMFNQATDVVTKGSAMVPTPVTTFA
jgi:hypothetical protein